MSAGSAAEIELLSVLVCAAPEARDALSASDCDLIVDICLEVAAIARDLPGGHPGRAARAGTELLLDGTVPHVDVTLRKQLAHAVEVMVVRRQSA